MASNYNTRPGIAYDYRDGTYAVRVGGQVYLASTYRIVGGGIGVNVHDTDNGTTAARVARYILAKVAPGTRPVRVYRRTDLPGSFRYDAR